MADLKHLERLWQQWKMNYLAGLLKRDEEFVFAETLKEERVKRWRCAG